jgi:hypothetical protein
LTYGRGHQVQPGGIFDAVALGEVEPGKWLNSSERQRRTQKDASSLLAETATPETLVKVAVTYLGRRVIIYRNDEVYADYEYSDQDTTFVHLSPNPMRSGTCVTLGLRSLDDKDRADAYFAGAIEEARIYAQPLTAEVIRTLTPNDAAGPPPLARWTFEDGTARDEMETFPYKRDFDRIHPQLHGGAYVADGKLHLDGVDDYLQTLTTKREACIAHMTSKNLVDWEYHPAIFSSHEFNGGSPEDPDYFELNGRHYFLFSSWGTRMNASGRKQSTGTYYVVADRREGPYLLPIDCVLMGTSRLDNYCGREIKFGDSYMLYSYTCGVPFTKPATLNVPRIIAQNPDGTLYLRYWSGLDKLETKTLIDKETLTKIDTGKVLGKGVWSVQENRVIGQAEAEQHSALWLPVSQIDSFMFTAQVDLSQATRAAVLLRWDDKHAGAVQLDVPGDTAHIGFFSATDQGLEFKSHDAVRSPLSDSRELKDGSQHLRVMVRAWWAEVYLNDHWLFGTSVDEMPDLGGIGLLVDSGYVTFTDLRIAEIEPLVRATYEEKYPERVPLQVRRRSWSGRPLFSGVSNPGHGATLHPAGALQTLGSMALSRW